MKRIFTYSAIIGAISCLTFLYWQHRNYSDLNFETAYVLYTENGCKPCWDFLENIPPDDIPSLEKEIRIGLISFLTQAHIADGYYDLSNAQKEENSRIEKLAQLFISKGADINYIPENSYGALVDAMTSGNSNLFAFLIDQGADVNVVNYINNTPIKVIEITKQRLVLAEKDTRLKVSLNKIISLIEKNHKQG